MDVSISVVVTVHNSERYLRECMDSVIAQTFGNIEILCIDGGSTDHSPEILLEYAKNDSRVKIVNDSNTSYGHKINRGIEAARGEYVAVLESDDQYEPFMLERLYEIAKEYHPDFVNADYTCFFDVNGRRFHYTIKMYEKEDYNHIIDHRSHPDPLGYISRYWTGIFSRKFLMDNQIRMNESPGASFQDMSFRFLTSVLANTSYHLDIPVYRYRIDNPGSSMHDTKKTVVIADEHDFLKKELEKRGISDQYIWHHAYLWKYRDFRGNMRHLKGNYRKELFDRYQDERKKDQEALERYRGQGYAQDVSEMISRNPQEMEALIVEEGRKERGEREHFYHFLDRLTTLDERQQIVFFGCGRRGQYVLEQIGFLAPQICCAADNSEHLWYKKLGDIEILPPDLAVKKFPKACYVVANKNYAGEISRQLQDKGIQEDKIIIY